MKKLSFRKMHGLGNDFVIIEAEKDGIGPEQARQLADRRYGIGCDQLLVIEPAVHKDADFFMRIYNTDGSEAQACGNGTRCVAYLWMDENSKDSCIVETVAGQLFCRKTGEKMVSVDMGVPKLEWQDIPLAEEKDTLHLGVMSGELNDPVAVNVRNPHTVFFVENAEHIDIETLGRQVERHVLFPERTNVEFAQVVAQNKIRVRVWERGAGVTLACGSGACAAIVAAVRRGLTDRKAEIVLDGGSLFLEWKEDDGHIIMTGPVAYAFEGVFNAAA